MLSRTVRGMMRYGEALDTLAQLEGVPEAEAAGWVSAKHDQPPNPDPNPSPSPIPNPDTANESIPNLNRNAATLQHLQHCNASNTATLQHENGLVRVYRSRPNTLIAVLTRTR